MDRSPLEAPAHRRTLLVMMPALNEEATVADVLARVPRQVPGFDEVQLLVIDDGSTDRTVALARAAGAAVLSHGRNLGVGAALQSGVAEAIHRGVDVAVNIDSDGQFWPEDIPTLLRPLTEGRADFVTASRFLDPALIPDMPWLKRWGNWGMSRLVSGLVGQSFADVSCGFRAYSREALLHLVLLGQFTYTQESFLVLSKKGLRMVEQPLRVRGVREHGQSRVASNLWRYARRTVGIMFSFIRDYSPGVLFNNAALLFLLPSIGLGAFFFGHRLQVGQFSPHIWAGFLSAFLFGLSAMIFALGQVAEMVSRLRSVQERQLYLARRYLPQVAPQRPGGLPPLPSAEAP
ncbi:MAG: glycosyltransferase family 2 protein [Deltaproteobacteria bacterium]|nr:glycosyltransferase family 2 protein [Deltaproteobacteria bacterium]